MHLEAVFHFVAHCNMNIVVTSMEVELGVDLHTAPVGQEVGDKWNQASILLC